MTEPPDPVAGMAARGRDSSDPQKVLSLLDVALVLAGNLKLLVIAPLFAGALAVAASFLITPMYTSTTTIVVPQQQQSMASALLGQLGGLTGGLGTVTGLKSPADQWIGLLKSRTVGDALVDQFKLLERYKQEFRFQARQALGARTVIASGKDGLISISVDDQDPTMAAKMAAAYTAELQKLSATMTVTEAGQRRVFFEQQLLDAKNNLVKAEQVLRQSGIDEGTLKTSPDAAVQTLASLKAQIVALEVRVRVMSGYLAEGSAELQRARSELVALNGQLAKAELDSGGKTANGSDYVARFRDFKYYETLYELLARQYESARVDEARDGAVIQIVDSAQVPEWKSKPKRAVMGVLTALIALIACVAFVLGRAIWRARAADPAVAAKLNTLAGALRLRR